MERQMEIAYFGYAGNPSHRGHLQVMEWLAKRYDHVIVGLSAAHAFGKTMAPMDFRLQLGRALLSQSPARNIELSDIEDRLRGDGPVYSYDVLCELRKMHPDCSIHLAVGPDNAEQQNWGRFYKSDEILIEFGRVVAPDMGSDKRSTHIRAMLEAGADCEDLAQFTTLPVAKILIANPKIYGKFAETT